MGSFLTGNKTDVPAGGFLQQALLARFQELREKEAARGFRSR